MAKSKLSDDYKNVGSLIAFSILFCRRVYSAVTFYLIEGPRRRTVRYIPDCFVNQIRRFYDFFLRLTSLFYESSFPERRHVVNSFSLRFIHTHVHTRALMYISRNCEESATNSWHYDRHMNEDFAALKAEMQKFTLMRAMSSKLTFLFLSN